MRVGVWSLGVAAILLGACSRCAPTGLPADSGAPDAEAGVVLADAGDADAPDGPSEAGPEPGAQTPTPDAARPPSRRLGDVEVASVVVRSGEGVGVRGVFAAGRPRLRACYERALSVDPSVRGDMMLSVGVREDGSVGDVAVGRSPLPPGTTGCFTRAIAALRFAPSTEGSRVDAKVVLTPR